MSFTFSTSFGGSRGFSFPSTFPFPEPEPTPARDTLRLSGADDVLVRALSDSEQAFVDDLLAAGVPRLEAYARTLLGTGAPGSELILEQLTGLGIAPADAEALIAGGAVPRPLTGNELLVLDQLVNSDDYLLPHEAFYESILGPTDIFTDAGIDPADALGLIFSGAIRRPFADVTIGTITFPLFELAAFTDLLDPTENYLFDVNVSDPAAALAQVAFTAPFTDGPSPADVPTNALFGGDDSIYGRGGDDLIVDLLGNNSINTGRGDDDILLGDGNDRIYDTGGNNTVLDLGGNNVINMRDNLLASGIETDTITTGDGNDNINAFNGRNIIDAGNGDNYVRGGNGFDEIRVGLGDDLVDVMAGTRGETEPSQVVIGSLPIPLTGALDAHNVVVDLGGDDFFRASATPEAISDDPTAPPDQVFNGNDFVLSDFATLELGFDAFGDDTATLGDGNNAYVDLGGNDSVTTGRGTDSIFLDLAASTGGNDTVTAGAGSDTVASGGGSDEVRLGPGNDFLFETPDGQPDTILYLTDDLFRTDPATGDLFFATDQLSGLDGSVVGGELLLADTLDVGGIELSGGRTLSAGDAFFTALDTNGDTVADATQVSWDLGDDGSPDWPMAIVFGTGGLDLADGSFAFADASV